VRFRICFSLIVAVVYLALPRLLAAAEEPVSSAAAQTLFDEGRALLDAQRVSEACQKFAQSQRLDPSAGTLLNLAVCHEQEGKLASAWLEFSESWSIALREGRDDRARLANERMTQLKERLSWLLIRLTASSPTSVLLDGAAVSGDAIGVAIPINPGEHVLEARGDGRVPQRSVLHIGVSPGTTEITIPELALAAAPAPPSPPATKAVVARGANEAKPQVRQRSSLRTTSSYALAATALTAAAAGTFFGLKALSLKGDADDACPQDRCSNEGSALSTRALSNAQRANLSFAVAGVSAGVALYLWLSTPSATPEVQRLALGARKLSISGDASGAFVAWRTQF